MPRLNFPDARRLLGRAILATLCLALVAYLSLRLYNHLSLQSVVDVVLKENPASHARVGAHFERMIDFDTVCFDVRGVPSLAEGPALLEVFYQFASELKDREFAAVKLSYRGRLLLTLPGETFARIGQMYGHTDMASLNQEVVREARLPGGNLLRNIDRRVLAQIMAALGKTNAPLTG
ncbi:hypothetical protein K8I61_01350 [bacterium]|nr:hypothetical protein [bacterium]